jgi:hypothetical protein
MIEFLTTMRLTIGDDSRISVKWLAPTNIGILAFGGRISIVMAHRSTGASKTDSLTMHLFTSEDSPIDHNSLVRFYPHDNDPNIYTEYNNAELVENLFNAMQDLMKLKPVK